jgi:hypothetical protein
MKLPLLIFAAFISFTVGCAPSAQVPNKEKAKSYPTIIKVSTERQALAKREWGRLLETYGVTSVEPDLYTVTATPRSILMVTNGIKIVTTQVQPDTEEVTIREASRKFIDRWRELLAVDPANLSLVSDNHSNDTHRLTYRQSDYSFPVAGNFGELTTIISKDGRLIQLDDRLVPPVELPLKAVIDRQAAAQRVANRTFTYRNVAGQPQSVKIEAGDVVVKELVVYPIEKGETIEVHLAWEITAGKSLVWNVYIDAINGEDLGIIQKFNT